MIDRLPLLLTHKGRYRTHSFGNYSIKSSARVLYYAKPLTAELLRELLQKLGLPARDVVQWKEPLARSLGITREISDDELILVSVDNADLLQRPIVVRDERACALVP